MKKTRGFTLIELSIVLIIISLIVGGITSGKALIKSAEVSKLSSDILSYTSFALTFRDQYDYLPGDLPNAQEYWPDCLDTGSIPCNGNGDNRISGNEPYRSLEHLSLADLVNYKYRYEFNVNPIPIYEYRYKPPMSDKGSNNIVEVPFGQFAHLSSIYGNTSNSFQLVSFKDFLDVSDIVKIDKKIDDGKASEGIFLSYIPIFFSLFGATPCVDAIHTINLASADYLLANKSTGCISMYKFN